MTSEKNRATLAVRLASQWLGLVGLAAVGLALASCDSASTPAIVETKLPAGETRKLAMSEISDLKVVGAQVATRDQSEALARIGGTLVTFSVREGDQVRKGQQIGMIIDARNGYDTSAFSAQVAAAQAESARADAELSRIQYLFDNGVYAKARLDQSIALARASKAQVAAAQAQRSASANLAQQGAVLAPASGRVLRADIPAGAVVAPGMSLATITAGDPILRLDVPESVAGQVQVGTRVNVRDETFPAASREGQVVQVYPSVVGGQVRVDARLPGLGTQQVGRRINAVIEIGKRRALIVPRRFVTTQYGIDQVLIVGKEQRTSSVPVQTASIDDPAMVEILSGVAPGDTLFVSSEPAAGTRRP